MFGVLKGWGLDVVFPCVSAGLDRRYVREARTEGAMVLYIRRISNSNL